MLLELLPVELLSIVFDELDYPDQVNLALVNSRYYYCLKELLWRQIELFCPSYHELQSEHGRCFESVSPRVTYRRCDRMRNLRLHEAYPWYQSRATRFLSKLAKMYHETSRKQLACSTYTRRLAAPVLCSAAPGDGPSFWTVFPAFTNLESLNLAVDWEGPANIPGDLFAQPALSRLERVRLYGYVPEIFVAYILQSAPTIKMLDMTVLDSPTLGEHFSRVRASSPLSQEEDLQLQNHDVFDLNAFHDNISPRSLKWVPRVRLSFPRLTHLRLCSPSQADPKEYRWGQIHYSRSREVECIESWMRLIGAASTTLEHLVLEHRPTAAENAPEDSEDFKFLEIYEQPSNEKLIESFLPLLKSEDTLTALTRLDLRGIMVKKSMSIVDERLRRVVVEICERRRVSVRFCLGMRMNFCAGDGVIDAEVFDGPIESWDQRRWR